MAEPALQSERPFVYTARTAGGARKKGRVTARDTAHATQKLRLDGLYPIDIKAAQKTSASAGKTPVSKRKLTQRNQADLITRLAKLTTSQIPLDRALSIIAEGKDGALPAVAGKLRVHIREGGGLVDGMVTHLGIKDAATLALVRGAEVSGDLPQALRTAADILQQRLMLVRRIGVGLLYPGLLLLVALLSIGLIMIAVIPQFRPLVEGRMDMVPLLGRMIFGVSASLSAIWPLIVTGLILVVVTLWWLHRQGKAVPLIARIAARLPLINQVIWRNQVMIILHSLGALLRREVTLSAALQVILSSTPPGRIKTAMTQVASDIETGQALSQALSTADFMSAGAIEMVRIGEETGDLAGMITRAADEMRDAADRDLERFLALFQPALIIFVGLLVGVSLYALFSAIVAVNAIAF
ncbi:type II secretion system protein F (GspF) [Yoonia maricola]|uniref:Type II secretion system protein F (GspF) n=1 Tax=Yoonia maricola TaxID=420999 RepID=A0A2M8W1W2_9RHOB|nr:type II secretion system F family protein [Yoonia maricola]PJI84922.1 type II secretion system protein F (GspF) [Yoonia maricola]